MLFALTDQKLEIIFKTIRLGMPMTRAAILANISDNAFRRYRDRGNLLVEQLDKGEIEVTGLDEEQQLCLKLVLGMQKSRAEGIDGWLQTINDAGSEDWRSAAWLADRRGGPEFQKRTHEEQTVVGVQAQVSIEQILEMKRQLSDWESKEFGDDSG